MFWSQMFWSQMFWSQVFWKLSGEVKVAFQQGARPDRVWSNS